MSLGIETLKTTSVNILELGKTFADVFEDGKFNILTESFQLGKSLVSELPAIIKNGKAALAELKDLTPAEAKELAAHIQQKFDIANDQIEAKIEHALDLIVKLYETIKEVVAFGKTLKKA